MSDNFCSTAVSIFTGLTGCKKAEVEIPASKNRYDLLLAVSGQLAYEYDLSTGNMIWGPCLERILGYAYDEMRGGIVQWQGMIHPEDRESDLSVRKGI